MVLVAAWALGLTAIPTAAQVCTFGSGGGSSSGGGGATLTTITVDGTASDWASVLANANQVTFDGEWVNCSTSTDRDYVINPGPPASCASRSISGRDLAQFAWTYDSTNVYLYVKRYGSTNNTQTFYFYMDTGGDQRLNTNEKVYQVQLNGSNRRTDGTLYNYTAVDSTNGDSLVAPAGSTYPGYADGYTVVGSLNLANPTTIYSNVTGGFADGTGFEARIPWTNMGIPVGTPIYFHVSSTNTSNPAQVPASIDDNLGGVNGQVGAFAFRLVSMTPDHSSAVTPANPTVVEYLHTVTNAGTLPDRYDLTAFSNLGLRVDLYDGTTLIATDSNGDGDFSDAGDYVNGAYDSNADGRPNTPVLAAAGTFAVKVKITAPSGVEGVQDVTTLSAFSQGDSSFCASAKDTTAIGNLTLTPTPQAKSVVAGQTVDYGLTLGNFSLSDTFDLRVQSSLGWNVTIYTDPNGDGNPADGVLIATDTNGNGVYTDSGDSITGGYDTNSNSRPDFGAIANGDTQKFVVRLTALGGAMVGTVDTCSVLAQGATLGSSATAILTSTVRTRLTFTPSYTVAAGTNKYSGQAQSVFYAHTLTNSWPSDDSITLSSSSSPTGWTIRYWTDPNGDGNPGDGTLITGSFALAANGGTLHIVVEVAIPSGLSLPLTHTAVVTATGAGSAPTVTDEVRVSYVATYADGNRSVSQRVFALCQTIYAKGSSLVANSTYTFRYINPPPASTVIRTATVQSDGNGEALDQYTLTSGDTRGTWTLELRNASDTFVDSETLSVDPPAGTPSTVSPVTTGQASYTLTGDNLSISATFNNTSTGADYTGTTYRYLVRTPDLSQYLRSDGVFASYTGSELTRSTSPHTVYASSSASETVTVNGVEFPATGVYRIDVSWVGSCSNTIATATLYIPVGTTLASYQNAGHTVPQDSFGTGSTVYLAGTTYLPSTTYSVAYYRPDGTLAFTHSVSSTAGGSLSDSAAVAALITNGTWHAVVYQSGVSVPPIYNAADATATNQDSFVVDTVSPAVTVNTLSTTDTTPALSGTINDPAATVQVIVNGNTYTATNNGDGTWTLPDNAISPALAQGVYDVTVLATDATGNVGSDSTSNELTIQHPAPVVSGPILAGASSITGTSTSPVGTTITVYSNGTPIGTATVQAGGVWTLTGVTGLVGGESITATAGTGAATSAVSNAVVVTPAAPVINGPLVEGQTSVTGTSTAPPGSTITVTVGGVPYTTTVQPDGTWSVTVPALDGNESVSATVTTNGQTSSATTTTVDFAAPTVGGPILGGATSISGTSTSPVGTTITVYNNGTPIGTTTVQAGGVWTLTGVTGLVGGESITATAGTGAAQSAISNTVIVQANASLPPIVSSPILAGGAVTILGSSVEPPGSLITVYFGGIPVGTTTVLPDGTWSYGPVSLADGQVVSATAQAPGETVSPLSNAVTVATNSGDLTPAPVINGPISSGATSVSGTSVPGASVDVYVDGVYLGTTVADGAGNWTLPSIGPLSDGAIVSATATLGPAGTSPWSAPVVVGTIVHLLRNDLLTAFSQYDTSLFPGFPSDPSLEVIGPNHVGNNGEGALQQLPGSSDDDYFYMRNVISGTSDPDATVLTDDGRPLVFYQLVDSGATTLYLNKSGGQILITFTP